VVPRTGTRFHQDNYRNRLWARVCRKAGLGAGRTPKNLRDTFACLLMQAGLQEMRIGKLLGHSPGGNTTRQYYLKWIGDDDVEPMRLEPGEVSPDLLRRLSQKLSQSDDSATEQVAN
jgi:integrase